MDARIRFYKITQCGYYDHSNFQFGNIADILENLKTWISDKALNETQTYTVNAENNESNLLRTFCYSIDFLADEYLMTTWNENADVGGKLASVDGRGMTGNATVETAEPSDGFIPGYPAFFWIIPSRAIFATIQLNTRLNGHENLNAYLNGFLNARSQYVRFDEIDGENKVVGYGNSDDDCRRLQPKFSSTLYRQPGQIEFIRNNREAIRKLIKKDKFKLERPETTAFWQNIYRMITGQQTNNLCQIENKVSIELDMNPTAAELENIISQWETDSETYPVSDVGFILAGNPQPFWLRQSLASARFDLDVHFTAENVLVPTDRLLSELHRRQDIIFNIIRS
ncbi:MAG: hypothetical protein V8T90_17955 [Victivallales bacterium]